MYDSEAGRALETPIWLANALFGHIKIQVTGVM